MTGHLLLLQHFFGFSDEDFGNTFAVLIQLGAILALLSIYFTKLWRIAIGMVSDPGARRFVLGVLIAFLPAAVVGALLHGFIKGVLFNPWIVCFSLIFGGGVLLLVDALDLRPRFHDATGFTLPMYLIIGVCQCLSMISGVSRSGATIVSAMLLGADRRSAAEVFFYLAMPTMAGAFAYDLYKNARAPQRSQHCGCGRRLHHVLHRRLDRGQAPARLCVGAWLRSVCLVAGDRGHAWAW